MSQRFDTISQALDIEHFYSSYLEEDQRSDLPPLYDLSLGEIDATHYKPDIHDIFVEFCKSPAVGRRLTHYNGTAGTASAAKAMADLANSYLGLADLNEHSVCFFDGGQNALFSAVFCSTHFWEPHLNQKCPTVVFPVPAYPYWSITTATGASMVAIEAFGAHEFVEKLKQIDSPGISAILVNAPHNPLGYVYDEPDIDQLNCLARDWNCPIVVDLVYALLARDSKSVTILNQLDPTRTIYCDSVSKSMGLPGLRLGMAFSRNLDVMALMRAFKSAQSLLPSAVKFLFFEYLLKEYPDYVVSLRSGIEKRYYEFQNAFAEGCIPGLVLGSDSGNLMYHVVETNALLKAANLSIDALVKRLEFRYSLRVSASDNFYPCFPWTALSSLNQHSKWALHQPEFVTLKSCPKSSFFRVSFGKDNDIATVVAILARAARDIWVESRNSINQGGGNP